MAKIAILGLGTVGSGVAEVLEKNAAAIGKKAGEPVEVKYILGRHPYPDSPYGHLVVEDFSRIENDPEVTVVAECIGGCEAALDYTRRAMEAGKSVVTSNKELVAEQGDKLLALAREKGVHYFFEASVGGGIPVLRPMASCMTANEITQLYGILNGTTNYILTKMIREGLSFQKALEEAQEKGYAEADPTADVEGQDACRKLCILSALAFGRHIYPRQVPTQGITAITRKDVALAQAGGRKIKLLGRGIRLEDGRVAAYVAPHLVPQELPLANVEDVFNGIVVCGDAVGEVMFYGQGAGKLPTASAVVSDLIDCVKGQTDSLMGWGEADPEQVADPEELVMAWYLRTEEPVHRITHALGDCAFLASPNAPNEFGVITAAMSKKTLKAKTQGLDIFLCLPVLA